MRIDYDMAEKVLNLHGIVHPGHYMDIDIEDSKILTELLCIDKNAFYRYYDQAYPMVEKKRKEVASEAGESYIPYIRTRFEIHRAIEFEGICPIHGERISAQYDDSADCVKFSFGDKTDIFYSIRQEEDPLSMMPLKMKGEACIFELIHTPGYNRGKGYGTKAMESFFRFAAKELQLNQIYGYVQYMPDYYPDGYGAAKGIHKLVSFYEKLGFSVLGEPTFSGSEIDMEIRLNKKGKPIVSPEVKSKMRVKKKEKRIPSLLDQEDSSISAQNTSTQSL